MNAPGPAQKAREMIRVLMITARFYAVVGGAEKQVQNLAIELVEKR